MTDIQNEEQMLYDWYKSCGHRIINANLISYAQKERISGIPLLTNEILTVHENGKITMDLIKRHLHFLCDLINQDGMNAIVWDYGDCQDICVEIGYITY